MNSRQLQYAVTLARVRSFSQVAQAMNISQPALSKQILSLEGELGVKLFDRSTTPLTLTPAGQHFIREARQILYREDQLLCSMERFRSGETGKLVIGVTPFRSFYLIPGLVKEFRAAYPGFQVTLQEARSDLLRRDAAEGKFDFAVVNLPVDDSVLDIRPLESDRLMLAVPAQWKHLLPEAQPGQEIDFGLCKDMPFAVVQEAQEMRVLFEKLCAGHGFRPHIATEVVSLTTAWSMAVAGVAATILPQQFLQLQTLPEGMTVLHIKDPVYTRQPAIITKKGQYISEAAQFAMDLLARQARAANAPAP